MSPCIARPLAYSFWLVVSEVQRGRVSSPGCGSITAKVEISFSYPSEILVTGAKYTISPFHLRWYLLYELRAYLSAEKYIELTPSTNSNTSMVLLLLTALTFVKYNIWVLLGVYKVLLIAANQHCLRKQHKGFAWRENCASFPRLLANIVAS